MWYVIAGFSLLLVGIVDGHFSSFVALSLIYVCGFVSVNTRKTTAERTNGTKVFGIVFSIYVISALIANYSFHNGQFFYVSDSMKYIERNSNVNTWSWTDVQESLIQTYLYFIDDNGLYNNSLAFWAYIANHFFDGTTVLYLTLFQTLFGVLAILEIYKIFTMYFEPSRAAKYACIFGILSLFHIYSILIIRDIMIAYFYLVGIRKVIGKTKASDGMILFFILIITTGIRLYTGLFFGVFIMLWLYKLVQNTKYAQYRIIIVPIIVVGILFVGAFIASTSLVESTEGQVGHYDELYNEEGGSVASFRDLPIGIRQIVTLFFSQLPLAKFDRFAHSTSFSNFFLSVLPIIYKLFGFVVFYGLIYYYFIKGYFKKMEFYDRWILIFMLIFVAITMSTHVDVRRSMEAVPFFYLFYILVAKKYKRENWKNVNSILITISLVIMVAYAFL